MCGINGIIQFKSSGINLQESLKIMNQAIKHRGPDALNEYISKDNSLGFGHARLSILDLSDKGNQPMESFSGRYLIVFNGEIYNHLQLRETLLREQNISFRGTSDTETLLSGFEIWGVKETLKLLEGMFAFAVYDSKTKTTFLARDRVGEKPLYVSALKNEMGYIFSSELKSIKRIIKKDLELNIYAVQAFFRLGYVPDDLCIYENTFKIQPGQLIQISKNSLLKSFYWTIDDFQSEDNPYEDNFLQFKHLIKDSVKKQMLSDVPIGAMLSGGIDSSLIVSIMQELNSTSIETFSIGFEEDDFDESKFARSVASHLGTSHNEYIFKANQAIDLVPSIAEIYDEPFADSSQLPTLLVSKFAKSKVKVALTGDGGDELFGGYNRHLFAHKYWPIINLVQKTVRLRAGKYVKNLGEKDLGKITNYFAKKIFSNPRDKFIKLGLSLSAESDEELYLRLISCWQDTNQLLLNESVFDLAGTINFDKSIPFATNMMIQDFKGYLPGDILVKVDRAAMHYSLETRAPFLSHKLVEFSKKLPIQQKIFPKYKPYNTKYMLRQMLSEYIPEHLINRPKMGFGIPLNNWLKYDLQDWVEETLSKKNIEKFGILNYKYIRQVVDIHFSEKKNLHYQLWSLLVFQSWLNNE
jgi:asparagine synthase (glutamine-hydrolysing)